MKIVLILCAVVGVAVGFKCYDGADNRAALSIDCPQVDNPNNPGTNIDETKCAGPVHTDYAGYSSQTFKCGECPGTTVNDGTCWECEVGECNKPLDNLNEYKCYTYQWDPTDEEWQQDALPTLPTCTADKHSPSICNSPNVGADMHYSQNYGGCGPCDGDAEANTCLQCQIKDLVGDGQDTCTPSCELPDYIDNGYKSSEVNNVAEYECYSGFVMTPNKGLMTSSQNEGDDVTQAYMKWYGVGICDKDVVHLPECVDQKNAVHCGLPTKIEDGKAIAFMLNKGDGDGDADMPIMAKYQCDPDHTMHHTMKDDIGWCRKDGSMEIPSCEKDDDYFTMKFKLQNGNMKKFQRPNGKVFAGIVLAKEVDKDGNDKDGNGWHYGCNDGTNNYAVGAVCRSLGFGSGHVIPALKKMMGDKHDFGWTKISCKYDDTLMMSEHCDAWPYDDALQEFGRKEATCYPGYDIVAVECFDDKWKLDMEVKAFRNKMGCVAQFKKEDNFVNLEDMGNVKATFLLDDNEIETGPVKYRPRKGFFAKVNLIDKTYECASCKVFVDDILLGSAKWCKDV